MKKSLLFALAILLTGTTYAQYTLTDNDVIVEGGVLKEYTNSDEKNIIIPQTLNGQTVTVLGEAVFYSKAMTGVVIPNTVVSIEYRAFNHNKLTNVIIPTSVTNIGKTAFRNNKLISITLPNTVTSIGEAAFNGNSIVTVNGEAFNGIFYKRNIDGSENLSTIVSYGGSSRTLNFIPSSVTTIGNKAFEMCSLTSAIIPNTVISIGDYAFGTNNITTATLSNSITILPTGIFTDNKLTSISIPNGVTEIGYHAFYRNQLSSITFPNSLTTIDTYSFAYNNFTSLTFPNSVTTIKSFAFMSNKLTSVTLPNAISTIAQYSFAYNLLTNINIPNSVTTIERSSLRNNKLTNVVIPNSVTIISDAAFVVNEITNLEMPSSVTHLGEHVFNGNSINMINGEASDGIIFARNSDGSDDLSTIVAYGGAAKIIDFIPTSVKIIDDYAFYDNEFRMDLTSVTLPNSITTIGRSAFSYNKLTSIIIPKSVTDIDYGAFVNNEITSFILPAAEKSGYLFENWNGNIVANTEVTDLWGKYTANFSKILLDQTIDFEALSNATYGGDNIELTATSSSGLVISYTSSNTQIANIVNGEIVVKKAGTCNITASQSGDDTYKSAADVVQAFVVHKKGITVTANANQTKVYGDAEPTLTYTADALVGADTFSGELSRVIGENAGNYVISQNTLTAGANYDITFAGADFNISQKAITVTADANQTKIYGDAEPILTYTADALVGADTFSGELSRVIGENAGNYVISQNTLTAGANYDITFAGADFNISQKAITVTADANQTKIYGDAEPILTYTADALVGADTFSGALGRESGENVGFYEINIGNLSAGNNYNLTFNSENFEITASLSERILEASDVSIYPNPTKSNLYINNSAENKLNIRVIDLNGKVIIKTSSDSNKIRLDMEIYPSGVYSVIIEFEDSSVVKKIIKK